MKKTIYNNKYKHFEEKMQENVKKNIDKKAPPLHIAAQFL